MLKVLNEITDPNKEPLLCVHAVFSELTDKEKSIFEFLTVLFLFSKDPL